VSEHPWDNRAEWCSWSVYAGAVRWQLESLSFLDLPNELMAARVRVALADVAGLQDRIDGALDLLDRLELADNVRARQDDEQVST
jgi:hypothetical protein